MDEPVLEFSFMGSKFKPNYKKEKEPISIYKDTFVTVFVTGGLLEMCKESASGG
jgi:hypothetical protein